MNENEKTGEEADWQRFFVSIIVHGGDFYGAGHVNLSRWAPTLVKGTWSMVWGRTQKRYIRNCHLGEAEQKEP